MSIFPQAGLLLDIRVVVSLTAVLVSCILLWKTFLLYRTEFSVEQLENEPVSLENLTMYVGRTYCFMHCGWLLLNMVFLSLSMLLFWEHAQPATLIHRLVRHGLFISGQVICTVVAFYHLHCRYIVLKKLNILRNRE